MQGRRQLFGVGGAFSQLINYSYTCACFQCMHEGAVVAMATSIWVIVCMILYTYLCTENYWYC